MPGTLSRPLSPCAARLRGLLRRFGDSLLAMTAARMSLVYLVDAVPKVCELMHNKNMLEIDFFIDVMTVAIRFED